MLVRNVSYSVWGWGFRVCVKSQMYPIVYGGGGGLQCLCYVRNVSYSVWGVGVAGFVLSQKCIL